MRTLKIKHLKDGTPINEKEFFKWLDALGSGKYPQTRNTLENRDGFCCLGVACKVLIPRTHQINVKGTKLLCGFSPKAQTSSPLWLIRISDDVSLRTKSKKFRGGLIEANDNQKATFSEIKKELENIYVHGILDDSYL